MISELLSLESCCHRVVSGIILGCCLCNLESQLLNIYISEELKIKIIKVMTLSVTGGEKELVYLQSMIKSPDAKLVLFLLWCLMFSCL